MRDIDVQEEDWNLLIKIWKYSNSHIIHVINNVSSREFDNTWISALGEEVSLLEMIIDYPNHFKFHLAEITELMSTQ